MPFCSQCGREHHLGGRYCSECGAPLPAPEARPYQRQLSVIAAVAVLAAVALAVVAVTGGMRRLDLAKAASPDTEVWFEVDARPTASRMRKVKPLLDALERAGVKSQATDFLSEVSQEAGMETNWDEDVSPWIGSQLGISLRGLSSMWVRGEPTPPTVLGMLRVRNRRKAEQYLSHLARGIAGTHDWEEHEESLGRLKVHVLRPQDARSPGDQLGYALVGRVLYVSNLPEEIERAVERANHGGESWATTDWYRKINRRIPKDALMRCMVSPRLQDSLESTVLREAPHDVRDAVESQLGVISGGAIWLDIQSDQVQIGTYTAAGETYRSHYETLADEIDGKNVWDSGLGAMPKGSIGAASVTGVSHLVDTWASEIEKGPWAYEWRGIERGLSRELGLTIKDDLLGWIRSIDVALLSIGESELGVDLVCRLRGETREQVEGRLARIEAAIDRVGFGRLSESTAEGLPYRALETRGALSVYYVVQDDALVAATSRHALTQGIRALENRRERLASTEVWREATAGQGGPGVFAVFADVSKLADQMRRVMSRYDLERGGEEALNALKAIPWLMLSVAAEEEGCTTALHAGVDYGAILTDAGPLLAATRTARPRRVIMTPMGAVDPVTGRVLRPAGSRGGRRGRSGRSPGPGGRAAMTPGAAEQREQDALCQDSLAQLRYAVSIYHSTSGTYPRSLESLHSQVLLKCPVGGEAYEYDPTSGQVRCPHTGHVRF